MRNYKKYILLTMTVAVMLTACQKDTSKNENTTKEVVSQGEQQEGETTSDAGHTGSEITTGAEGSGTEGTTGGAPSGGEEGGETMSNEGGNAETGEDQPATDQPATDQPATDQPTTEQPSANPSEGIRYEGLDFSSLPENKSPDCIPTVHANDKYALIDYAIPGMDSSVNSVAVYSFEEGKVVGTKEFGESNNCYTLCDDGFYVLDEQKGTLTKYSFSCEQMSTKKFVDGAASCAYYSPEIHKIFYSDMAGNVNLYDVVDESTVKTAMENQIQYCIGTVDQRIIVSLFDETIAAVDQNGKVEKLFSGQTANVVNACTAATMHGDYIVFLPLQGGPLNMAMHSAESEIICSASGKYIVSRTQEEQDSVFVYNTIDMKCTTINVGKKVHSAAIVKNGVLIAAVCDESGNIRCEMLFEKNGTTKDIANQTYNQDTLNGVVELPAVSGSGAMVKATNDMLEKYNVRLLYNTDVFESKSFGFEIVNDTEEAILDRIDEITTFFDSLPKGLVNEAGGNRPLVLYVCKEITGNTGGFNTTIGGYNVIYIESTGADWFFGSTLAHEFGHALERNMSGEILAGWRALMPEEVAKAYQTEEGKNLTIEYTADDGGKTPVWFASTYGRTNELEDRATMFEGMYNVHNYNDNKVFEYENLTQKVRYWEKMLIATYDSCTEDTVFSWNQK